MELSSALFFQARSGPFGEVQSLKDHDGKVTGYTIGNKSFLGWATHWLKYHTSGKYRASVRDERKKIAIVLMSSANLSVRTMGKWSIWEKKVIRNRKSFLRVAGDMAKDTEFEYLYWLSPGTEKLTKESAEGTALATDTQLGALNDAKDNFSAEFFGELRQKRRFESEFKNLGQSEQNEVPDAPTMRSLKGYIDSLFDKHLDEAKGCISVSQLKFASSLPLAEHGLSQEQADFVNVHFIEFIYSRSKEQGNPSVRP